MKHTLAVLVALATLSAPAVAQQFPLTLPSNTVYGRLGFSAGPGQAIPLATLRAQIGQLGTDISVGTILSSAPQTLLVEPTANPTSTLASVSAQGTTVSSTQREFLGVFGLTNNITTGAPGADKVALYAGMDTPANTTLVQGMWSINSVLTISPNTGSNANYNAQGYELDFNNLNAHRGEADGGAGLAAPVAYGMNISGASTFRSTGALLISGAVDQWNRGIVVANNSARQASFQDLGHATISLDIRGSHTVGLDLSLGSFSAAAIKLANNSPIGILNAAGNTLIDALYIDASNVTQLGGNLAVNVAGRVTTGAGLSVGTTADPGAGQIYTNSASYVLRGKTSWTNGAAAQTATLTNGPVAGNPTKWLPFDDNGTLRWVPSW